MKQIKLFLLVLIIQSNIIIAQDYNFISKDLHLMSEQELMDHQVQFTEDTPMFDVKGNNIDSTQINDIMSSGNFYPQIFGDKKFKAQAIVFRKTTAEEKKEFLQALAMTDPNANFVAGQMAKDIEAYDIDGSKISLKDLKGKVVVLNFWFPQCQPCVMEMPELNTLVKKYKDDNVVFISVTFEKKETVQKFLSNRDFNYLHITDNKTILSDYGVSTFPTHLLIDQNGEIILRKVGNFIKELDAKIGLLLKK
jgi:peroxiredoxin